MSDETIEAALRFGIALGKEEKTAPAVKEVDEKDYQGKLTAIFNASCGLIHGLGALRDMKGSTFDFEVDAEGSRGAENVVSIVKIKTNIPVDGPMFDGKPVYTPVLTINIVIPRENDPNNMCSMGVWSYNGYTTVQGDHIKSHEELEIRDISKPLQVEEALTFVAKYAAKRGLIP